MTTVNISITNDQARFINVMTHKLGFANRSEFVRALLRRVQTDARFASEAQTWPFTPPLTKSRSKIVKAFKDSGLYSHDFLVDLHEGLGNSNYFGQ